jgi:hypothetical protein
VPFAHCPPCGNRALIDPTGRCPEGHEVGAAAGRGAGVVPERPHPDEPTPWVGTIESLGGETEEAVPAPRTVRPPSLGTDRPAPPAAPRPAAALDGAPAALDAAAEATLGPAALPSPEDSHDLLRELQALGQLSASIEQAPEVSEPAPVTPQAPLAAPETTRAPAPVPPAPAPAPAPAVPELAVPVPVPAALTPPASAVTPGSPAPPSSPEEATEVDDLAMLAAVIESLDGRADASVAPVPTPGVAPAPPRPAAHARGTSHPDAPETASPRTTTGPARTAPTPTPEPAAETTTELPAADRELAPVGAALFDGNFTARGNGRRGGRRHDGGSRRALFRR